MFKRTFLSPLSITRYSASDGVNDEWENMWKEAVVAEVKALYQYFLEGLSKDTLNLSG
jgi:hypothetical protein